MKQSDVVDTIELDGFTVNIIQDDDPMNPREEWDNLGTMVCFHNRYNLGDKDHGFSDPSDFREWLKENPSIVLPLYLYDHSGISMSTGSFSDPWDSGQVGWIYVTYVKIRKEYSWKYITSARAKQIQTYLKNEVETYDQYLTGDVYGFQVVCNECKEDLDSCWGFYGSNWKENGLLEYVGSPECPTCKAKREEEQELDKRLMMVTQ
jgi:hypothetical protein